jgi:hypothetical protein
MARSTTIGTALSTVTSVENAALARARPRPANSSTSAQIVVRLSGGSR